MASRSAGSRVFSYIVAHDAGFAPNPFYGCCTLACCKPRIRKTAQPGDLIVGLSRRSESIVYIMRVAEKLDFASYWSTRRYRRKRPDWSSKSRRRRSGDNIYEPRPEGDFTQHRSRHWDHENDREHEGMKAHDTAADAVLIAKEFTYFGADGPALPEYLGFLRVQRGHRCRFTSDQVAEVERFFQGQPRGIQGRPGRWSTNDTSWRESCASS